MLTRLRTAARAALWGASHPGEAVTTLKASRAAPSCLCPACGYEGPFRPHGARARPDARCPSCGSVERHRLFKLFLDEHPGEIESRDVLHFAAEPILRRVIMEMGPARYVTADLFAPADVRLDIESMELPDGAFETVICNHVLEHVDDGKALAELFRIIAPGGVLIAMVPLIEGWAETFEPEEDLSQQERVNVLGNPGHRRIYGRDFPERMAAAGFEVSEHVADGYRSPRFGLLRGEKVFMGRKF